MILSADRVVSQPRDVAWYQEVKSLVVRNGDPSDSWSSVWRQGLAWAPALR